MGKPERATASGAVLAANFRKNRVRERLGELPCDPSHQHLQNVGLGPLRHLAGAVERSTAVLQVAVPISLFGPRTPQDWYVRLSASSVGSSQ